MKQYPRNIIFYCGPFCGCYRLVSEPRFDMSSDNASSTVTYTSVSSDLNGPSSWGIPLENAGEIPDMDPYEEVAQQGQEHPLSPAYVPDPNKKRFIDERDLNQIINYFTVALENFFSR
ncbi:hypothetical protein Tco_1015153 [Tanacetum coccineum]|uniref:Uncharacterized protein n=1 Tax=Tanacetum coccineum TaxID=301880 RepID=A0ABQ5FJZ7_9ASTR